MIHYWIKDQLQVALPDVDVTVDYEPDQKEYITVFYEGGGAPGRYDLEDRHPNYMVWIQSPDYSYAEYLAERVFDLLHNYHRQHLETVVVVDYYKGPTLVRSETVQLQQLTAVSEPNRIGVEDSVMQYSVNFTTTIIQKEETVHE